MNQITADEYEANIRLDAYGEEEGEVECLDVVGDPEDD